MILAVTTIILLTLALGYVLYRYYKLASYAKKADLERLALAIQLGELKESQNYIRFK